MFQPEKILEQSTEHKYQKMSLISTHIKVKMVSKQNKAAFNEKTPCIILTPCMCLLPLHTVDAYSTESNPEVTKNLDSLQILNLYAPLTKKISSF